MTAALKKQRPPAVFRHDDHNETAEIEECNECHHVYENGEKVADESSEDQRCSDCHTEKTSGNQPGLRKAFHLNCKGCHQTKSRAGHVRRMSCEKHYDPSYMRQYLCCRMKSL